MQWLCYHHLHLSFDWLQFIFFNKQFINYAITVFPLYTPLPSIPDSFHQFPLCSSCPCVMCISSLAIPFPILFLTSPCLFYTCKFVLFNLCTFYPILVITLQMISISMVLFLFCLFAQFLFQIQLLTAVNLLPF